VDSAFVRTWFGDPGQADHYAEYALRDAPHSLFVTLPADAVSPEFRSTLSKALRAALSSTSAPPTANPPMAD
jgi:hypothetical protein